MAYPTERDFLMEKGDKLLDKGLFKEALDIYTQADDQWGINWILKQVKLNPEFQEFLAHAEYSKLTSKLNYTPGEKVVKIDMPDFYYN